MSIRNFIQTVWSETLLNSLEQEYVAVRNCSRDFEKDFDHADCVKVCSINPVKLFDYVKNAPITSPEVLSDSGIIICPTMAKGFNFQIDDIDLTQSNPKIMQSAMKQAANALANDADRHVFGLFDNAEIYTGPKTVNPENIIDAIISLRETMLKNGVNSNTQTVLEVSPEIASIILKANITHLTNNEEAMFNGYIGSLIGFDVYVSNNVYFEDGTFKCYARTKRAITFVEQIKSIEAYRPENLFADAVKGLYYYGGQIVYPNEIIVAEFAPEQSA